MLELKKIREAKKISQEQLASALGIDRSTVTKWETSDIYPRRRSLMKLANILHCTIDQLYGREPPDGGEGGGRDSA